MKTGFYVIGDFSPLICDSLWYYCGENEKKAKRFARKFLRVHPYGQANLVGSLSNIKKIIKKYPNRVMVKAGK